MLQAFLDKGAWFAPKRFGYGAGLPIKWQGWALIAAYLGVLAGIGAMDRYGNGSIRTLGFVGFVLATTLFIMIVYRRTDGAWRWRWGEE